MSIWSKIRDEIEHKNIDTAMRDVKHFLKESHACSEQILDEQFDNDEADIAYEIDDILQGTDFKTMHVSVANFTDTFNQWHFRVSTQVSVPAEEDDFEDVAYDKVALDTRVTRIIVLDGLNRTKNQISNLFSQFIIDSKNIELKHQYDALSLLALLKFFKLIKKSIKNVKHNKVKFEISEMDNDYLKLIL